MDTGLYRDIVYTEYMLEHDLTWQQMMEKTHTDEMLKRVAHMEWQMSSVQHGCMETHHNTQCQRIVLSDVWQCVGMGEQRTIFTT